MFEGANPAADRMLGISHAKLVGLAIEDAWPGLVGTEAPDRYRAACRDGTSWSVEALEYKNGGIEGIFEVRAFQTGAGRAAVMFLDITEQQKTREAVRRSEESYRVAAEQTGQLLLQRLGFEPLGVPDGERAVAAYREAHDEGRPFTAVIMDLTVTGGMGGKETVREVLTFDPAARVIVSSGYSNDPIVASFGEYGFAAVLPSRTAFSR